MKANEGRKVNIHAVLDLFTSGQLLFLGSYGRVITADQCAATNVCNAAFAAGHQCRLTGNPIDFQSTVVYDRLLTTIRSSRSAVAGLAKVAGEVSGS